MDLESQVIDKGEGGGRGKNVSAYAIADDLEIRERDPWSGWIGSRDVANAEHNINEMR